MTVYGKILGTTDKIRMFTGAGREQSYLGGQIIKHTPISKIGSPKAEFDRTLMKLEVWETNIVLPGV